MRIDIQPEDRELLREIIKLHPPEMAQQFDPGRLDDLELGEIDAIINSISLELQKDGFGVNYNPTPRGYDMERLIDVFTKARIALKSESEQPG